MFEFMNLRIPTKLYVKKTMIYFYFFFPIKGIFKKRTILGYTFL